MGYGKDFDFIYDQIQSIHHSLGNHNDGIRTDDKNDIVYYDNLKSDVFIIKTDAVFS
jgi:hypothetical protein